MMKKTTKFVLIIAAAASMQACGNADKSGKDSDVSVLADSVSDTTTRAQALSAEVDLADDEKVFMLTAATGGNMEVEAANLAIQKTKNQDIKAFAQQMLKDHSAANKELALIAKDKGISLPTVLPQEKAGHLKELRAQADRAFDTSYMKMMIEDHNKTVALFTQGRNLADPGLKAFAEKTLPVIELHYQMALKIGKTLNLSNQGNGDDLQGVSPNAGHTN